MHQHQISRKSRYSLLYVVDHAYPYYSDGYAVRTHEISRSLRSNGANVIVVAVSKGGSQFYSSVDGVVYLNIAPLNSNKIEVISEIINVYKPTHILGASNWRVGILALSAAKKFSLPFAYEVRGFWELTRIASGPFWKDTPSFLFHQEREQYLYANAEQIFTLTRQMSDYIKDVSQTKADIQLVPNGLSEKSNRTKTQQVESKSKRQFVIGYVGSFTEIEGLEMLVELLGRLQSTSWKYKVSLLLVGAAPAIDSKIELELTALADELGINDLITLTGRVDRSELDSYYSTIDVFIIPRRRYRVCQLVSPIKPIEAALHGKAIVVSDVAPLADMASEAQFATFKAGSLESLLNVVVDLLGDDERRREMSQSAKRWALGERNFGKLVAPILDWLKSSDNRVN